MRVQRELTLHPSTAGTRVRWHEQGHIENPALRWMKVLMPKKIVEDNVRHFLSGLESAARTALPSGGAASQL